MNSSQNLESSVMITECYFPKATARDELFDRKANVDYNPNLVELEKEVRQKLFFDIVGDEVGEYFIKLLAFRVSRFIR